jgi:L-arabinose isomerase
MEYKNRLGLFGIGLDPYWPPFKGLKARLEGYLQEVVERLQSPGVEVVNLGLIDTPAKALGARSRFSIGAQRFVNECNAHGPAHHCAVGVGHIANKTKKLGLLLGLETVFVC